MRLIKMLGLAAIAAAAFAAFIGASSASAANEHPLIRLCKTQTLLLCAVGSRLAGGGTLTATQEGTGKFEGGLFTEECTGSTATGKIAADEEKNMLDENAAEESQLINNTISTFTFSGCKPCTTVKVNGLPLTAKIKMKGAASEEWFLKAAGSATFEGCTFGAKCKFGGGEITTKIEMTAAGSFLNTAGTELKLEEGSEFLCGGTGKWFAKFKTSYTPPGGAAGPVWLTLLKKGDLAS